MSRSEEKFSTVLRKAIDLIAVHESKKRQVICDELGYSIGRQGGSPIHYWIYQKKIPSNLEEVVQLARSIAARRGWEDEASLYNFLVSAGHPRPEWVCEQLCAEEGCFGSGVEFSNGEGGVDTFSPFLVGPPILNPHQFFGRERELRRIFNAIGGSTLQHVAVVGVQRSGKTSLLHYVKNICNSSPSNLRPGQSGNWLSRPQRYRWVFIDFHDPRMCTQEGFIRYVLSQLQLTVKRDCNLSVFMDMIGENLRSPTVILLDEVQVGFEAPDLGDSFWWGLRSLGTHLTEGRLGFVLASQKSPAEMRNHFGAPSPFFNIFGHTLHLGPLTRDEASELIHSSRQPFEERDVDWILEKSGCWPALVQILCQARLNAYFDGSEGDNWKDEALAAMTPYRYLLDL